MIRKDLTKVTAGLFLLTALLFSAAYSETETRVSSPVVSVPAGFYDNAFMLEITSIDGDEIFYTLDSSDPRVSETALCYSEPVSIVNNNRDINKWSTVPNISLSGYNLPKGSVQKGMVVRCACRNADGIWSDDVINTYFVGKKKPYYYSMGVISLVTDGKTSLIRNSAYM